MISFAYQSLFSRKLAPSLLAVGAALIVQSACTAADATIDPVHAAHVADGTMPADKPKDGAAMSLVITQLREKVAQLEMQVAKAGTNQPAAGMAPGAPAAMKPSTSMDAIAAAPGGSPGMMDKMDKMMGMMDKMMSMEAAPMPPSGQMAAGAGMPAGGAMPAGSSMPTGGKPMAMDPMSMPASSPIKMPGQGMNMEKMKMAQMMGMASMSPSSSGTMSPSALPGFPGASHLYHIGATDFFLDHQEHISLTIEQQASLRQAKEKALMAKSSADRAREQAEQELWALTASDEPNSKAIGSKIADIGKIAADERYAFILAVGEASKFLTDQQRQSLTGFAPAVPTPGALAPAANMAAAPPMAAAPTPGMAPAPAVAPMGDM